MIRKNEGLHNYKVIAMICTTTLRKEKINIKERKEWWTTVICYFQGTDWNKKEKTAGKEFLANMPGLEMI